MVNLRQKSEPRNRNKIALIITISLTFLTIAFLIFFSGNPQNRIQNIPSGILISSFVETNDIHSQTRIISELIDRGSGQIDNIQDADKYSSEQDSILSFMISLVNDSSVFFGNKAILFLKENLNFLTSEMISDLTQTMFTSENFDTEISEILISYGFKAQEPLIQFLIGYRIKNNEEIKAILDSINCEWSDSDYVKSQIPKLIEDLSAKNKTLLNAIFYLGEFRAKEAVDPLVELYYNYSRERHSISIALLKINDPNGNMIAINYFINNKTERFLVKYWEQSKQIIISKFIDTKDPETFNTLIALVIRIGDASIIPLMIKALETNGNSTTAELFLNSGNSRLEDTGEKWASQHGYAIYSKNDLIDEILWGEW